MAFYNHRAESKGVHVTLPLSSFPRAIQKLEQSRNVFDFHLFSYLVPGPDLKIIWQVTVEEISPDPGQWYLHLGFS